MDYITCTEKELAKINTAFENNQDLLQRVEVNAINCEKTFDGKSAFLFDSSKKIKDGIDDMEVLLKKLNGTMSKLKQKVLNNNIYDRVQHVIDLQISIHESKKKKKNDVVLQKGQEELLIYEGQKKRVIQDLKENLIALGKK